jgi:leader peptidase (prepilin peptidase) / N-methyltransferase
MLHILATVVLAAILIPIAIIDQRRQVIPNIFNAGLLLAGLIYAATGGVSQLLWAIISVVLSGSVFAALRWAYGKLRKRPGLGWGDVKFLAAAGAWVAPALMPWVVLAASMSALLYVILVGLRKSNGLSFADRIAFGPHLAVGLFAAWLLKPYIFA